MKYDTETTNRLISRWLELNTVDDSIDEASSSTDIAEASSSTEASAVDREAIQPGFPFSKSNFSTSCTDLGAKAQILADEFSVPRRSIIAKLSSLGLYKRKGYTDKRGNLPIKKERYVEMIAEALDKDVCLLESLEKVNKSVLKLILEALA
jgi:hypothetical protein